MDRDAFAEAFDTGVPMDASTPNNQHVLLIYSRSISLPTDATLAEQVSTPGDVPTLSVKDATENCDFLNIILTEPKSNRAQCIAVMGQYESFHIQKFMRLDDKKKAPVNRELPLRIVNRGSQANGRLSTPPPPKDISMKYWDILQKYLLRFPSKLELLRPVAHKVAKNNAVVVLVCNHGQSELLLNFVCAAKARGFDLSVVLLFATDVETKELAESLGITVFYDFDVRVVSQLPESDPVSLPPPPPPLLSFEFLLYLLLRLLVKCPRMQLANTLIRPLQK